MNESLDQKSTKSKLTGSRAGRVKVRLLKTYYGNILKDMRIVCITGTTGKSVVAHYLYHILMEANEKVGILASEDEIKVGSLYKFFSDSWKAGADYCIITTPASSLKKDVFYQLPVYLAALTDYVPSKLSDLTPEEYAAAENTLFDLEPEFVVLNRDDANFLEFSKFKGKQGTATYGSDHYSDTKIERRTLYRKGSEATLNIEGHRFNIASFLTGEPNISYMAAAATIASLLHYTEEQIVNGIANFDPENIAGSAN